MEFPTLFLLSNPISVTMTPPTPFPGGGAPRGGEGGERVGGEAEGVGVGGAGGGPGGMEGGHPKRKKTKNLPLCSVCS